MHAMGFPAAVDRYRLIQQIARAARQTYPERAAHLPERDDLGMEGVNQAHVARRARVAPALVANVENLETCVANPSRRPSRERLVQVLSWGLKLGRQEIEALLWLFDGSILSPREVTQYLGHLPDAVRRVPPDARPSARRAVVVHLLEDALLASFAARNRGAGQPAPGSLAVGVTLYAASTEGRLTSERALRDLETLPGQRMRTAQLPSLVSVPPGIHDAIGTVDTLLGLDGSWTEEQKAAARLAFRERTEAFAANIAMYGARSIIQVGTLQRYLQPARTPEHEGRSLAVRRRHVEHLARQIAEHEYFHLGLVPHASDLEVNLKSLKRFMLRSAQHREVRTAGLSAGWGPHYIGCDDEAATLQFYLDFEKAWARIPADLRDRANVVDTLDRLIADPDHPPAWLLERLAASDPTTRR